MWLLRHPKGRERNRCRDPEQGSTPQREDLKQTMIGGSKLGGSDRVVLVVLKEGFPRPTTQSFFSIPICVHALMLYKI